MYQMAQIIKKRPYSVPGTAVNVRLQYCTVRALYSLYNMQTDRKLLHRHNVVTTVRVFYKYVVESVVS